MQPKDRASLCPTCGHEYVRWDQRAGAFRCHGTGCGFYETPTAAIATTMVMEALDALDDPTRASVMTNVFAVFCRHCWRKLEGDTLCTCMRDE